jgi:hypothetical protein
MSRERVMKLISPARLSGIEAITAAIDVVEMEELADAPGEGER